MEATASIYFTADTLSSHAAEGGSLNSRRVEGYNGIGDSEVAGCCPTRVRAAPRARRDQSLGGWVSLLACRGLFLVSL